MGDNHFIVARLKLIRAVVIAIVSIYSDRRVDGGNYEFYYSVFCRIIYSNCDNSDNNDNVYR